MCILKQNLCFSPKCPDNTWLLFFIKSSDVKEIFCLILEMNSDRGFCVNYSKLLPVLNQKT